MRLNKRITSIILILLFLFGIQPVVAEQPIKVVVNGSNIQFDSQPIIENGRTLVPMRKIFEALGATVDWNADTKTAIGIKGNKKVVLTIGSTEATVSGVSKKLDVPSQIVGNRTLVPLRFISESLGTVVNWNGTTKTATINDSKVKISFLDVGQADSILVESSSGKSMLIDAGNNADSDTVINYIKSEGISKIDILVATHPHEDHIGAMDEVIESFDIGKFYMPKVTTTTKNFEDLILAVKSKGEADIIAPDSTSYSDLNDYSAVIKLKCGNETFLLDGDAESISEQEMLNKGYNLNADVLKVGHHGSSSSTTSEFLKAVSPKYAVISVGKDNDYGHPTQQTLNKLSAANVQVFRTDDSGTIVALSDGNSIAFDKQNSVQNSIKPSSNTGTPTPTTTISTPTSTPTTVTATSTPTVTSTPLTISATPTPTLSSDSSIVYITKTGEKYHKSGCRYLARSKIPISLSNAKARGYTPCSVCNPPE